MVTTTYQDFMNSKSQLGTLSGFKPLWMPDFLFDFQAALVDWNIRKGKSATFADCGLGKTPMQLVWAENVVRQENKPVLILTPLAVSHQTVAEADKFGIEAHRSHHGEVHKGINVTNYERLHFFDPNVFAGVVADESSILKSYDGVRRNQITEFMRRIPYRLLCTATAAPNDYIELGTSSEALGELGYMDMLTRFFKNEQNTIKTMRYTGYGAPRSSQPEGHEHTDKWRFKGHAEIAFWKWVCSWARAIRRPSDLGFDDGKFILPDLVEQQHVVAVNSLAPGMLFATPAVGLNEQREERRRTIRERCEKVADLVGRNGQSLIWCHLNPEGDLLERIIPGAVQVSGKDSDESKEEKFIAFTKGQIRDLITKHKIGAWGLNLQNCAHMTSFPSHSFEQYYQGVRRCWRFGQTRKVVVDIVTTEGEKQVLENQQRKSKAADKMFSSLVQYMSESISIDRGIKFTEQEQVPAWL